MKFINVESELPVRLDRYLKKIYPNLSQGVIEKALRLKQIKVNQQKALANLRVKNSDQISIDQFFVASDKSAETIDKEEKFYSINVIKLATKLLNELLLYEDDNILAINKPNNLSSQGGSKIKLSINDALNYLNTKGHDLRLVHRLDKETSGCFILAKNYAASVKLGAAFKDKIISKTYHAITLGAPKKSQGQISNLIAKARGGVFESVVEDKIEGKLAITDYKLLKKYDDLAYLEFKPLTGRMHQLRFHAKTLGIPILGDRKYGNQNSVHNAAAMSDSMLLHAQQILIPKEIFSREIIIEAKLPKYFKKFMQ